MQRSSYAPPPAHSPPLHHPVPQHVSTVPMMRSPPPPQSQGNSNYGSPYGGQAAGGGGGGGGASFVPGFGGFMNDPTAQMGYQVGKTALNAGQEMFEQNVLTFFSCPSLTHITTLVSFLKEWIAHRFGTGKPLRLHPSPETLLQRLHPLRPPQTPPRPLPLATPPLVPRTATLLLLFRFPRRKLLFPSPPRRHQFPRHVHPRHGHRHVHPAFHSACGVEGRVSPGGHGADGHDGVCGRVVGDFGVEVRDVYFEHQQ